MTETVQMGMDAEYELAQDRVTDMMALQRLIEDVHRRRAGRQHIAPPNTLPLFAPIMAGLLRRFASDFW